jgi:hypothetical protein
MSNMYYRKRYTCDQDCTWGGCPGHELVLGVHNTSDTLSVSVDGEIKTVFGDNQFCALMDLAEQKPERLIPSRKINLTNTLLSGDARSRQAKISIL